MCAQSETRGLGENRVEGEVLISDGYRAYARYAEQLGLTHAQCWATPGAPSSAPRTSSRRPPPRPSSASAPCIVTRRLFCWTEVGAEVVATLQSLSVTCQLHDIDPYAYLVDVLQRIDRHPAAAVHLLIPRLWKQRFADNPLRSDLSRSVSAQ